MIPFNKQTILGKEFDYITDAYEAGTITGDGKYTRLCTEFMENKFRAKKVFLTTSCTSALELAALMINVESGNEIIMPSYTFVSTVNAFVLRGAKPVFCDIRSDNLNIDETRIEELITDKTKAIVPVHYAGVSCDMDVINKLAEDHNLYVIEDAAQGVNAKYREDYLGTLGDFGCYSFHGTKNYSMGEGGALLVNKEQYFERAEIIREKGTNRKKFLRGQVDKYTWVDIGSSYLPSDILAAVLWCQLEHLNKIQTKRRQIYEYYYSGLKLLEEKGILRLPVINDFAESNYHMFYILLNSMKERTSLISYLGKQGVQSVFHYIPLHKSDYYRKNYEEVNLPVTEELSERLLRLPMYYSLSLMELKKVVDLIINWSTEYEK